MAPEAAAVSEFDDAIRHASADKRAVMAERVTALFVDAAESVDEAQVALFDEILARLIDEIETAVLAAISRRIAPVPNAPGRVIRRLAGNDDIAVAGPVLRASPRLTDPDLVVLATRMGQPHLLAIAQRDTVAEPVTEILVERGDGGTLQAVAANRGSRFSEPGFATLVKRATGDDRLAETIGLRPDLPPAHLRRLLGEATEVVRRRLLAASGSFARPEIEQAVAEAAASTAARIMAIYGEAQRSILALVRSGKLDEAALRAFAENGQRCETVASISALARLPIHLVERVACRERLDALLVLGRAMGFEWRTMRPVVTLCAGQSARGMLETTKINFDRLSQASAEHVVRCWRHTAARAAWR
jgi:uncharacterized protein (DUF2336 family)